MTTSTAITYTIAPPVVADTVTILGLDASSTAIGWVVYDGAVLAHGQLLLTGADIADRCRQAHAGLNLILSNYPYIDAIAIESPVAAFAKALIPQARVSGALLAVASLKGILTCEVTPSAAKAILVGSGTASKTLMQAAAEQYGVSGEHAADALGVALAALGRVRKETV